jgi:hypothetical protein
MNFLSPTVPSNVVAVCENNHKSRIGFLQTDEKLLDELEIRVDASLNGSA